MNKDIHEMYYRHCLVFLSGLLAIPERKDHGIGNLLADLLIYIKKNVSILELK